MDEEKPPVHRRRRAAVWDWLRAWSTGERGQGMVEYAFIISLVVIVLILIVAIIGKQTGNMYSNISNGIGP